MTEAGTYLALECQQISESIRLRAEEELGETELSKKNGLKKLRELIAEEKHLNSKTSDEFLLRFLRAKKFDFNSAFSMLKRYYSHKLKYPVLYSSFTPEQNLKSMEAKLMMYLPFRNEEGSAIFLFRIGDWDPETLSYENLLRLGLLCTEKELRNPVTQVCGVVSLLDFEGLSWSHLFHLPYTAVKCVISAIMESFPMRHKAIHVVNHPSIFGFLFTMAKPFLSHKIRNRIYFHGQNLDRLHHFLAPVLLPEEYGGTAGPFETSKYYGSLMNLNDKFLADVTYGYSN